MDEILQIIILIEAVFLFSNGILLVLNRKKNSLNSLLGSVLILFSYYLYIRWLFLTELIQSVPFLINTEAVALMAIPPLLYYYVVDLFLAPTKKRKHFTVLLLVPIILGCCWYVVFHLFFRPPVTVYFQSRSYRYQFWGINASIYMLLILQLFVYFIFILVLIHQSLKSCTQDHRRYIRSIFLFVISLTLCMVLFQIVMQFDKKSAITILNALFGAHAIFWVFFSLRHPEYNGGLSLTAQLQRRKPLYNNKNEVERILKELDDLITRKKIYCDPNITLQELSTRLNTTIYNLSFLLNENVGMNFRSFINYHRTKDAEQLLSQETDMTILEIAFHVGFSSKSTFNALFKKQTGFSPSEYRNLQRKG